MAATIGAAALALLIGFLSFASALTDPTDASILNQLYTSLNSAQQLTNWKPSGGDPCAESWRGVICSGNRVTEIQLSGLQLTGNMGYELDKLTAVTTFDISNNNLINQIPFQLPPNVERLNLAGNGFNADLPFSLSSKISLKYLNLSHNQIQGNVNVPFNSLTALTTLDFSYNALTGDLPQSFESLTSLHDMYLENNQFTGTIDVLANLPLQNLNVENNSFTGSIPEQLKGINLRTDGNVFNPGPALPSPPRTPPANIPSRDGGNRNSGSIGNKSALGAGAIAGIIVSVLVVGSIAAFFFAKWWRARKSPTDTEKCNNQPLVNSVPQESKDIDQAKTLSTTSANAYETSTVINLKPPPFDSSESLVEDELFVKPISPPKKVINTAPINAKFFSVADLQIATDSFSVENRIGGGSRGTIYRAQMNDGKILAVKKISSSALKSSEDFLGIVTDISKLKHPHITEFIGYCSEHGQHLLVYEFYKNGSLYEFLHLADEFSKPLIWSNRVKIALGTAKALEYLHEVCSPPVVHNDIRTAKILLDTEFNPHLTGCGLERLEHDEQMMSGYVAPEVAMSGVPTIKGDVYSFGIVMLELLTGLEPFDSSRPRPKQSLVQWAAPQLHDLDALSKMVDPALNGLYPVKSLSGFADIVALCVQVEPEFRPPMSEVAEALARLVQRTKMSKRTFVGDGANRAGSAESVDYTS